MTVNKTQGPSADDYRNALDSLFAPPGSSDAKASDLDLLPGGSAKPEGTQTSFKELGQRGVQFGKTSAPGASGQITMTEGVGTKTTANPEFNRSPGARAAMAHGGLVSKYGPTGRMAWSPKLPDQPSSGHITEDRKFLAHVPGETRPKGPQPYQIHSPMTFGVHAFDGDRAPAFRNAPLSGLLEYTKPQGYGVLFPYDPV